MMTATATAMIGLFVVAALRTLTTFPLMTARPPYVFVFDVVRDRRSSRFNGSRSCGYFRRRFGGGLDWDYRNFGRYNRALLYLRYLRRGFGRNSRCLICLCRDWRLSNRTAVKPETQRF